MDNDVNLDNAFVRYRADCDPRACIQAAVENGASCNKDGTVTLTAHVTNTSGHPIQYVMISPAVGATYTVSPNIANTPLNNNLSTTITLTVTGANPTQPICLTFLLQDADGRTCCAISRCFDIHCDCMKITQESLGCDPGPAAYAYTFTVQNLSGNTIQQLFAIPSLGTLTPQLIATNLAPYSSMTITLHLSGVTAGQTLCVMLQAYGQDNDCCLTKVCFTLPPIEIACD